MDLFSFGEKDIVVCKRGTGRAFTSLTMLSESNPSEFSETTFDLSDNVRIVEILESSEDAFNPDQKFLRCLGIRDNEEVLCLEVHVQDKQLIKSFKVHNRTDRCDFRWPFYAYVLNSS